MKKNTKSRIFLSWTIVAFIWFFIIIGPNNSCHSNSQIPSKSDSIDLSGESIFIDDLNPDYGWKKFASDNAWCSGNGTFKNPYVLSNFVIDGYGALECITIQNSNVHFDVMYCRGVICNFLN